MLLNNVKLELNVLRLPLMKLELKNLSLRKCGKVLMVPLEIYLMELFLDNLSLLKIYQDLFQDGKNQSLLDVMLLEINIKLLILLLISLENSKCISKEMMELNKKWKYIIMKVLEVLVWVCTIPMKVLNALLLVVSNLPFKENILFILQPKILS
jgi:hypothetical protein